MPLLFANPEYRFSCGEAHIYNVLFLNVCPIKSILIVLGHMSNVMRNPAGADQPAHPQLLCTVFLLPR